MDRRDFLKPLFATAGGLYFDVYGQVSSDSEVSRPIRKFGPKLKGRVILPNEAGFASLSYANNGRYRLDTPWAIAECLTAEDIRQSILWAREQGVPFAPRAGGHNFAGYSSTSGLLISLTNMKAIELDVKTGVITVSAGVQNRDLASFLRGGDWLLPSGTCPAVGVSGLVLGGGVGHNSRWGGLTADHLLSTTLVTAKGEQMVCSATQNADLFWACRGAAGRNFGIHSAFTFQLRRLPRSEILAFGFEFQGAEALTQALAACNKLNQNAPDTLSCAFICSSAPEHHVSGAVYGQYIGSKDDGLSILAPLMIAKPSDVYAEMLPWWRAQAYLTDEEGPSHKSYWSRNRLMREPLSDAAIALMVTQLVAFPHSSSQQADITFLYWLGGAVNRVAPRDTAFVHRNSQGIARFTANWAYNADASPPADVADWMAQVWDQSSSLLTANSYQNFPDPALQNWQQAYYGENLTRLMQIKKKYDSDNVFNFAQSIPLA